MKGGPISSLRLFLHQALQLFYVTVHNNVQCKVPPIEDVQTTHRCTSSSKTIFLKDMETKHSSELCYLIHLLYIHYQSPVKKSLAFGHCN